MAPDIPQGLEPLRLMALKAAGLVDDHHVKGPVIAVMVHQPGDVLPVDHEDVPRTVQRPDPLLFCAEYRLYL